ncbi:purple acid phosphatase 8 [Jatropha curcas]|uniref:purple acid phosphatase 8 n=1 Tax=Jatropha curcas TaxID=180498 RepID=UPI001894D39D|nr:purple acid phosphatase 8 [Jatropha curcas]
MAFLQATKTCIFVFASIVCFCLVSPSLAELPHFEQPLKPDGSLSFLVIGDWGRKGDYNQSEVAVQMGIIGEELNIDFVVSTGDNFYEYGLTGVNDPSFYESFTNIYTAPSLQKQWYSVQVRYAKDTDGFVLRSFIVNAEIVEFFFVDTTPFINDYFDKPDHTYDWRGVLPREDYLANLLEDLDAALQISNAKWKIVVGHHAILSAGHHGLTKDLIERLVPILEEHNVDIYMNGHDHCLQHIARNDSKIQFLTSGGGSKAWRGDIREWNPEELKLYHDGQGFMSVQMTGTKANFVFYDVVGTVLHQFSLSKEDHSAM